MILRIFTSFTCRCFLLCLTGLGFSACSKKDSTTYSAVSINISHVMNDEPLARNTKVYVNPSGESYTVSRFRYYLSNFSFITAAGSTVTIPPSYFLVDDSVNTSKTIQLDSVPQGNYTAIRFLIGVDSARNNSGVQSGALAPENGLFWTWNSGYIMAQLEGYSTTIGSASNQFQFHIGGYKGPYNVLQPVTIPVNVSAGPDLSNPPVIKLRADVAKWFMPNTVSFRSEAVIMAPGAKALSIAGNYQQMFTVKQ